MKKTPREVAESYGLTTADRIDPPPRPGPDHDRARERWAPVKRLAFDTLAPVALCLVATDGPVSVITYDRHGEVQSRFGHNRGVWPARLAKTGSIKDTVTAAWDKNPFMRIAMQFRVWLMHEPGRDRLCEAIVEHLAARSKADGGLADLRHSFVDLGPDLDMAVFELEVHDVAKRLGLRAWSDTGLSEFLDRVVADAQAMNLRKRSAGPLPYERAAQRLVEAKGDDLV